MSIFRKQKLRAAGETKEDPSQRGVGLPIKLNPMNSRINLREKPFFPQVSAGGVTVPLPLTNW